jgi:hypothetical protein
VALSIQSLAIPMSVWIIEWHSIKNPHDFTDVDNRSLSKCLFSRGVLFEKETQDAFDCSSNSSPCCGSALVALQFPGVGSRRRELCGRNLESSDDERGFEQIGSADRANLRAVEKCRLRSNVACTRGPLLCRFAARHPLEDNQRICAM